MKTGISHVQFIVRSANLPFYKDLFAYLGWQTWVADDETVGVAGKNGESLWFIGQVSDADGPGVDQMTVGAMNHLAIDAESQTDVDTVAAHLTGRGVEMLYETPRHRPEFAGSESETYYQIMFETPDRILLEFVYTGPHQG